MNIQKIANKFRNSKWAIRFLGPLWYPVKYKQLKQNYRDNATDTLLHAKSCLENAGLFFWLNFGTLLGAYRENDFIKHDMDIDISLFAKDVETAKEALLQGGFKLFRVFETQGDPTGALLSFIYKGVNLDVYFFVEENNLISCHSFYWQEEDDYRFGGATEASVMKYFFPNSGFTTLLFKEHYFNVPNDIENYLTVLYGPNFMKPVKKFDHLHQCRNITKYSKMDKVGVYTAFE